MNDRLSLTEEIRASRQKLLKLDREGQYWTDEERAQVVQMFENGVGISEIAILMQRTEPAIFQQIELMDLYKRRSNPVKRRKTPEPKESECTCETCKIHSDECPRYKLIKEGNDTDVTEL